MNESREYSEDEERVLKTLFDSCDEEKVGSIHVNQLPGLLVKIGKDEGDVLKIVGKCSNVAEENGGMVSYEQFREAVKSFEKESEVPAEGPDPKVVEFMRILEEYRVKCEEEGNYLEAGRAHKQLDILRTQEEKRQQKAIRVRQITERQDVQLAHNMQFSEFNAAWDRYMEEYDNMAQVYIQQMTERHAIVLLEYQKQLRAELASKPPKWSKELLEWRRRQHILARGKKYSDAQKLKRIADKAEQKEKEDMEQQQAIVFARREAKYRQQQQAELQALLKRIEARRKEHIKQRNLDSKRLLQRNRNVQAVLETKQNCESQRLFSDIKKNMKTISSIGAGGGSVGGGSSASQASSMV
mmetsp:Transcript_14604/g.22012  ORF Transcript_14604/g.22012 Transcript_14604/m.22012 type:complete len:355 (+) Transcript_14604:123-1187(+)|eukprot:CAMPEP_0185025622 /NCGR_PEP_ID=MMETSP1103-20130426/8526_1 /TAXON_ID=36769 /ORGANISM="Paraphysomonas bandaiensis, Strain Caron Lab Isolate" /LENGTH=354 /DNA_ID=CAMNT_0027558869 /DNA_START=31 /DNA_END=1095 /DNA_ORIENTATION=+